MVTAESDTVTPSLSDVWKVLMQIKANIEKLVQEVEILKSSYKDFKLFSFSTDTLRSQWQIYYL